MEPLTPPSGAVVFVRPLKWLHVRLGKVEALNPQSQAVSDLQGQVDLVSRLIMGVSRVTIWVIGVINLPTKFLPTLQVGNLLTCTCLRSSEAQTAVVERLEHRGSGFKNRGRVPCGTLEEIPRVHHEP